MESIVYAQMAEVREETTRWWHETDEQLLVGTATILFVEDEEFVREVTCEVLRSAGYTVLAAKDAGEALRIYDRNSGAVELLLTDIVLRGENGRELAGRLRRENPALKVLFVTGYAEQMGLNLGEREQCLAKPFSTEVLLRNVRQLLDFVGNLDG
jgi:CheY-like chemotaxis protein